MGGEVMLVKVLVVKPSGESRVEEQELPDEWFAK